MKKVKKELLCRKFVSWNECYHTCVFYPMCKDSYRIMEDVEE